MRKWILFIVLLFLFCLSCRKPINTLENTKWVFCFEECFDYLFFRDDDNFELFSCETGDTIFGKYEKEDKKLLLKCEQGTSNGFEKKSLYRVSNIRYYLIMDNETIRFSELWQYDEVNKKWEKSDFVFEQKYEFKRDMNCLK